MKSTGIVRKIDALGRIVLPIEIRRTLDISERDSLEIYVERDNIILRKFQDTCAFCGGTSKLSVFKERSICSNCVSLLKKEL